MWFTGAKWIMMLLMAVTILGITYAEETQTQDENRSVLAQQLLKIVTLVEDCGDAGMYVYIAVLAVAIVLCLPCTMFEIIPGFLFGPTIGAIVSIIGKNLGSFICVLLAKTVLSGYVKRNLLPRLESARVVERMAKKQGFVAILIFRGLVYAPLPLKNYGLGVLDIPAWQTCLAAVLTGSPYAFWWAYVGSTAKNLAEILDGKAKKPTLFTMPDNPAFVAVLVIIGLILLRQLARAGMKAWAEAKADLEVDTASKDK